MRSCVPAALQDLEAPVRSWCSAWAAHKVNHSSASNAEHQERLFNTRLAVIRPHQCVQQPATLPTINVVTTSTCMAYVRLRCRRQQETASLAGCQPHASDALQQPMLEQTLRQVAFVVSNAFGAATAVTVQTRSILLSSTRWHMVMEALATMVLWLVAKRAMVQLSCLRAPSLLSVSRTQPASRCAAASLPLRGRQQIDDGMHLLDLVQAPAHCIHAVPQLPWVCLRQWHCCSLLDQAHSCLLQANYTNSYDRQTSLRQQQQHAYSR